MPTITIARDALYELARLADERLTPAPRARALSATLRQIGDLPGVAGLQLFVSDLHAGLTYLWACYTHHPEARAEGPIRSRMATVRELGEVLSFHFPSSDWRGAIQRFRAVWQAAASFPDSGVDDARSAAIRATLARECAFLED